MKIGNNEPTIEDLDALEITTKDEKLIILSGTKQIEVTAVNLNYISAFLKMYGEEFEKKGIDAKYPSIASLLGEIAEHRFFDVDKALPELKNGEALAIVDMQVKDGEKEDSEEKSTCACFACMLRRRLAMHDLTGLLGEDDEVESFGESFESFVSSMSGIEPKSQIEGLFGSIFGAPPAQPKSKGLDDLFGGLFEGLAGKASKMPIPELDVKVKFTDGKEVLEQLRDRLSEDDPVRVFVEKLLNLASSKQEDEKAPQADDKDEKDAPEEKPSSEVKEKEKDGKIDGSADTIQGKPPEKRE